MRRILLPIVLLIAMTYGGGTSSAPAAYPV